VASVQDSADDLRKVDLIFGDRLQKSGVGFHTGRDFCPGLGGRLRCLRMVPGSERRKGRRSEHGRGPTRHRRQRRADHGNSDLHGDILCPAKALAPFLRKREADGERERFPRPGPG